MRTPPGRCGTPVSAPNLTRAPRNHRFGSSVSSGLHGFPHPAGVLSRFRPARRHHAGISVTFPHATASRASSTRDHGNTRRGERRHYNPPACDRPRTTPPLAPPSWQTQRSNPGSRPPSLPPQRAVWPLAWPPCTVPTGSEATDPQICPPPLLCTPVPRAGTSRLTYDTASSPRPVPPPPSPSPWPLPACEGQASCL